MPWEDSKIKKQLGIPFWNGSSRTLIEKLRAQGGLLTVPSGPGLVESRKDHRYRQALQDTDAAVMDSGYLALILKYFRGVKGFVRISGLQILEVLLDHPEGNCQLLKEEKILWVVPDEKEKLRIENYLSDRKFEKDYQRYYLAPFYEKNKDVEDPILLYTIKAFEPNWVILCIAGGKQEKLGLYLRERLSAEKQLPAILCTGAAIAFFTGGQARIPKWVDRMYLGWAHRILSSPSKYWERYMNAVRLPFVLKDWEK
ncbi:MAG: WecB/TagA/CpsF family glycosyltransferase [Opitutales bacterium]|nr:WecB/TagA/CpsF family glycosyltransferase [Opitutales bacterium]